MIYLKVKNISGQKIDFKKMVSKLKPFFSLVDNSHYPLYIFVHKKKNKEDLSYFDLENNQIHLKFDVNTQSKLELFWLICHEFFHFIQRNNKEIGKIAFSKENRFIERVLEKYGYDKKYDVHDCFSYEIQANTFATMLVGKFFKRHFLVKNGTKK